MTNLFRHLATGPLAAALLMATLSSAFADISGDYFVYGRNADGSAYDGTARILALGGDSYTVNWSVGTTYSGQGTLKGEVFTVEWGSAHPAVYVVMPDGELHGTWADGAGLELMSPTPR